MNPEHHRLALELAVERLESTLMEPAIDHLVVHEVVGQLKAVLEQTTPAPMSQTAQHVPSAQPVRNRPATRGDAHTDDSAPRTPWPYITLKTAARRLGVSPGKISQLCNDGALVAVQVPSHRTGTRIWLIKQDQPCFTVL